MNVTDYNAEFLEFTATFGCGHPASRLVSREDVSRDAFDAAEWAYAAEMVACGKCQAEAAAHHRLALELEHNLTGHPDGAPCPWCHLCAAEIAAETEIPF